MSAKNMINLCSLNVNGLQNREKRGRAVEWVKSMKCDIAYFQEMHFDQNIENEINFNTDFNIYGSIGTSASRVANRLHLNYINLSYFWQTFFMR
jgi:exonuclease III